MDLAIPLSLGQIEAASRLHARSTRWRTVDRALDQLRDALPGFSPEATLIKAAAIDKFYSTHVFGIAWAADHVTQVLASVDPAADGPALVEQLARVHKADGKRSPRRLHSFAAKFAHFFIDSSRFAIFDSYAEDMVGLHLGRAQAVRDPQQRYVAFVKNVEALEQAIGYRGSRRELDRYIWIAGLYRRWSLDPRAPLNGEMRRLFEDGGQELEFLVGRGPMQSGPGRGAPSRQPSGRIAWTVCRKRVLSDAGKPGRGSHRLGPGRRARPPARAKRTRQDDVWPSGKRRPRPLVRAGPVASWRCLRFLLLRETAGRDRLHWHPLYLGRRLAVKG